MFNKKTSRARGQQAERSAEHFLTKQGLQLITRNFQVRSGEIDLIMKDGDTLVFIEVKHRINKQHGLPIECITPSKQHRIYKAAQYYLLTNHPNESPPCRFDAVGLTGTTPAITWIKDAFQVQY